MFVFHTRIKISLVSISLILTSLFFTSPANSATTSCKLLNVRQDATSLGFPRPGNRLKNKGTVKIQVLFANYPDQPALDKNYAAGLLDLFSEEAEEFYANASYGKVKIQFIPSKFWVTMNNPSTYYSNYALNNDATNTAFLNEIVSKADAQIDFSKVNGFLILSNPMAFEVKAMIAFTGGIPVDGKNLSNGINLGSELLTLGAIAHNSIIHELGHGFGLVDLYDVTQLGISPGDSFAGRWSVMSYMPTGTDFFAWEKYAIGWITDKDIYCGKPNKTIELSPLHKSGGKKMVVIPTSGSEAIVVENRTRNKNDANLPGSGIVVYSVNTAIPTGQGPIRVLSILGKNKSFSVSGITIKNNGKNKVKIS